LASSNVRVAQALAGHEIEIFAAERMAVGGGEIAERHLVGAADFGVEVMHGAGKAVGRQPLRHGIGLDEGTIDFLGGRCEDAVQADGVGHGGVFTS
jgi:hypothetical protein